MTKRYRVTATAGQWVAGRRVNPGDILTLTDDQAAYEVARRQIVEVREPERRTASIDRTMHIDGAPKRRGRGRRG